MIAGHPSRVGLIALLATLLSSSLASAQSNPVDMNLLLNKQVLLPQENEAVVMLEVAGRSNVEAARTPVAMAIVIDTSGSMEGQKIVDARAAAHALIDRLTVGDMATIISYSDSSTTILANHVISNDRSTAHAAINGIRATGSTCMSCGLDRAFALLSDASTSYTRRVVMLSDGNANRGISDPGGLRALASQALEVNGVPTSTIGLGYDYNEDLMTAIANGGNGNYYFLANGSAIAGVLDREFSELETVVAGNVIIRLTPINGTQFGTILAPNATLQGNDLVINLGQISASSQRQILVPIQVSSGPLGEVLQADLSYSDNSGQSHQLARSANMFRSEDQAVADASINTEVIVRYEDVQAARVVENALELYQQGNRDEARAQLQQSAQRLQETATSFGATDLEAQSAEVQQLYEFLDDDANAEQVDGLRRHNRARSRERSSGEMEAEEAYYDSMFY